MNDLPPLQPIPEPAKKPDAKPERGPVLRRSLMVPAAIAAAALIVGGAAGWGFTALATAPTIAEQEKMINSLTAEIVDLDDELEQTSEKLVKARDDLKPERDLKVREAAVESAETSLVEREAAVADVVEREAAVKAREDAAAENARSGDWWIPQVRECLARPGGYRMASATEGSLGRDVSCMSG